VFLQTITPETTGCVLNGSNEHPEKDKNIKKNIKFEKNFMVPPIIMYQEVIKKEQIC